MSQRISEERVAAIRSCLPAYLRDRGVTDTSRKFKCLSASHIDKHPSMSYKAEYQIVKCFSCGYTRDIIGLYADEKGLDKKHDFQKIIEELEARYLGKSEEKTSNPVNNSYLKARGLKSDTITHFHVQEYEKYVLGEMKFGRCIVIPYSFDPHPYTIVRLVEKKKFFKPADTVEPIFHVEELSQSEPVVIVEASICAMSVWQAGYHAIALNGTGTTRLEEYLQSKAADIPLLILCLDQDRAGRIAQERLHQVLNRLGIRHKQITNLYGCKDPNELLCAEDGERNLHRAIQDAIDGQSELPKSIEKALSEHLYQWLDTEKEDRFYSGIESFDQAIGGFCSRFYMIGGIPSSGKTSFFLQLALAFAKQHRHVLYLSYEASEQELIYKALSLISTEVDVPFSSSDIATTQRDKLETSVSALSTIGKYLHIDDSCPGREQIEQLLGQFPEPPILMIDYLQVIPIGKGRMSDKEKVDELMNWLYLYTKERHIPTFVISSFNRNSYYAPASLDSFKESGSIEYRADYIFALQLQVFSQDKIFQSDYHLSERKKKIEEELKREVRKMELVCLKNRYGEVWFRTNLDFHTKYSLFLESDVKEARRKVYQKRR